MKFVSSFWDDPRLAVAEAHDVILMDELKHLSSIESHNLVTQHLHKSVQILAKSMHFTAKYLDIEEKLTFAQAQIMNLDVENTSLKESVKKVMVESVEVKKQLETV